MRRSETHRPTDLAHVTCLLSLALLIAGVAPVSANPIPPGMLFCHVHEWNPGFCEANPITECEEILQYSEATGDVEFDLYYVGMAETLTSVDIAFTCPSSWAFVDFENCSAGLALPQLGLHECTIQWAFDPPAVLDPYEPFLLGRLRVDVTGFGSLTCTDGWYEGEPISDFLWMGPAMAGVGDCFCYTRCSNLGLACGIAMGPETLEIDVEIGDTAQGLLSGPVRFDEYMERCLVDFVCDEPWVTLSVDWPQYNWADITVTVDATDLPLGYHTAVVRAESECVECSELIVHVREPSGIMDDGPAISKSVSFGKIRSLYR